MCIRDSDRIDPVGDLESEVLPGLLHKYTGRVLLVTTGACACLLYTSDAADDLLCVDLGGRRIIKKKNKK